MSEPEFKKNPYAGSNLDQDGEARFWYYVVLEDLDEVAGRVNDEQMALNIAYALSKRQRDGEDFCHPTKVVDSSGKTVASFPADQ